MSTIKIVTDEAGDIPFKHEDLYDIEIIPIRINLGDESFLGRSELDSAEFYETLKCAEDMPETEPVSSFEFGELFSDLFEQGYTDIIYVSSSSKASSTYYNAVQARDQFFEDIPEAKAKLNIYCIDSLSFSAGYGYAVVEAAKMANRGKDAQEIAQYLRSWFSKVGLCFGILGLKFAKKSPFMPVDSAFVDDIIGLRPIMKAKNGEIEILSKVREGSVVSQVTEEALKDLKKGSPYCIIYSDDSQLRDAAAELLTDALGYPPADSYRIGAAIASHTGPEVIGVMFSAK